MGNFADLGINQSLVRILKGNKFERPTDIQEKTIPLILKGKDLIGQAETGSGKTAACVIPLIQQIDKKLNDVQVLILTPTRELALQYLTEVSSIAIPYGVTPFVVYGGFNRDIHLAKLRDGVQILVATPGRLIDIIYNDYFSLEHLKTLVIDEADEMLKMGFIEDVDFINDCIVQKHQTLLFSATMPDPIKRLTKKYMKDAVHIRLNREQVSPVNLKHYFIRVERGNKEAVLKELLSKGDIPQAIVFCNTRHRVKDVFSNIRSAVRGIDYLHGGLEQNVRTSIVEKFRKNKTRYLITTDVMARGIDISSVSHIINYDLPRHPEIYIHRTGRTARLGNKGTAVSLVSTADKELYEDIKGIADIRPVPFRSEQYSRVSTSAPRRFDKNALRRPGRRNI
ncbi:MAG: DEAD/DEAH box helicase [bacterium]